MKRARVAAVLVNDKGLAYGHLVNVDTDATACGLDATNAEAFDLRGSRLTCPTCRRALEQLTPALISTANVGVPA